MINQTQNVESSIKHKLSSIPNHFSNHSIYKVPEHIRKVNEQCYQPWIVSIGPIYYKNPSLTFSQELKLSHLQCFLEYSTHVNGNQSCYSVAKLIDNIKEREEEARSYYEEKTSLSSNEFIEMMLVDAAFIIYYFMCYDGNPVPLRRDPMVNKIAWMMRVEQDLFIEDNQLPFFVLNDLYNATFGSTYGDTSFKDVICRFISNTYIPGREVARTIIGREKVKEASNIKHLVDFLRVCCLPHKLRDQLNLEDSHIVFPSSVKEIKAAGVKFIAIESESILDIEFSKGILRIPTLVIQENTEAVIRSIVFFEQCHHHYNSYFIDYLFFLDALIDTSEDVRVLVQHGIIKHCLGSNEEVANLVNQITKCILIYNPNFYYAGISRDLNAYTAMRWNKWKAILRRNYFNHPWSIISVIYLVFLLILTVLQVYTGFRG
ncbi:UPF0481 protein At3g47200-like [Chenopodium quinoa]|uniref:UPF0481 protein At3g47200-like n=1 Tax=Chenopodium quinoa TaxID=63459 RepID=UPI000B76D435|nr:UPF0481 protein At3g47200-like [Chenopodium quinoa]